MNRNSGSGILEVSPGLYRLTRVQGVNAYLWHHKGGSAESGPILFDCGWPWSGAGLIASLTAAHCQPTDLRAVAVTHYDFDHVGQLAFLAAASQAEVLSHRLEAPRIEGNGWRRLPGAGRSLDPSILAAPILYRLYRPRPVRVTRPLEDGEPVAGGWVAVHTPGHTPGHTAYWHPGQRVLIAGDALGSVRWGRLRFPKPVYAEDWEAALASVQKLAALRPETICFGHGPELHKAAGRLAQLAETSARRCAEG